MNHRDRVIGIAHALVEGRNVGPHHLADGEAGGVVGRAVDSQARRQSLYGCGQAPVMASERIGHIRGHEIVVYRNHLVGPSLEPLPCPRPAGICGMAPSGKNFPPLPHGGKNPKSRRIIFADKIYVI